MALQLNEVLNSEQTEAAGTIEGPVLIIAGAGSGKTRMITYRIAYMLEQGIAQKHILALTFTNKAAHEMTDRITSVTGKPQKQLTASTFHAFGLRILRKEAHLLGYPANFTIYDTQDKMSMLKAVIAELGMDPKSLDLYAISEAISSVKTERVSRNELSPVELKIAEEYRQHLHLYHAFDFDDLIMQPLELFEAHPEVLELYRDRYRYILVDEFQDTSMQQYKLVRLLS